MVLRNVHSTLTEDYQLPYWVSYVAFAVATVLLGGILGLFLVCCIDCIYPPRRTTYWARCHLSSQMESFGDEEVLGPRPTREDKKDSDVEEEDDLEDLGAGSQDEGEETQEEDLSQDEDEGSQASQEEDEEQEDFRNEGGKARRRRARKAD